MLDSAIAQKVLAEITVPVKKDVMSQKGKTLASEGENDYWKFP